MIWLELLLSFTQIGFTSFGGLSMISVINREMTAHGWMTSAELSDIVAIAEMTPGPLGINCATFAGLRVGGLLGAAAATAGVLMPTFTVCLVVERFLRRFRTSSLLQNLLLGVRPACIGLTFSTILTLTASNYFPGGGLDLRLLAIGAAGFALHYWKKLSVPALILLSGLAGLILL